MARLAVVSGGGTGIGKAIAFTLAAGGDEVIILGRRPEVLDRTTTEINTATGAQRVRWHAADLSRPEEASAAVAAVTTGSGAVDVLVNNAGGNFGDVDTGGDLDQVAAAWQRDFAGNVLTAVLLTQGLLPHLRRPGGRVIALSSIAALRGAGSYGAAKAALHAWAYTLATQLAADGITVNVVAPGFVPDTEFFASRLTEEFRQSRIALTPVGRPGTPEEIAAAVRYLASPEAGFTTGQILQVNGGAMLGRG